MKHVTYQFFAKIQQRRWFCLLANVFLIVPSFRVDPRYFQIAVPWEPPGWRTPAASSSSPPAGLRPGGSPWHCATSCQSGGLWCGPGKSYTSESSPICLWCQSRRETWVQIQVLKDESHIAFGLLRRHAACGWSHLYFALVVALAGLLLELHAVEFCSQNLHSFLLVLQLRPLLLALCNHT